MAGWLADKILDAHNNRGRHVDVQQRDSDTTSYGLTSVASFVPDEGRILCADPRVCPTTSRISSSGEEKEDRIHRIGKD